MKFDERDLYTGLSALHWATISTSDPRIDKSFYKGILEKAGSKALELGCGAGRLLLTFLQEGFDVQGVDISGDMLSVCRQHANAMGLDPVLYEQQMQQLDLPDRFNAIYIPCGGFHRNELMWMLELAGFQDVDVKGDWTDETLNSEHEKEMIFIATKNRDK